ncbi:hypothetical protein Rumeso_02652 [Rubellimicrobium mesophilum DSM 19309]|uniref:Uncharacterized protein n=1 Tax=Rubellimicrobium mesophilum DSM 19309 TaxID=442562 RepID=A0A017HNH4_9RHOB|nr:hypothetical protein Rumeso_02652 [Rubellimicrobium mesophilum DSM 19309]
MAWVLGLSAATARTVEEFRLIEALRNGSCIELARASVPLCKAWAANGRQLAWRLSTESRPRPESTGY